MNEKTKVISHNIDTAQGELSSTDCTDKGKEDNNKIETIVNQYKSDTVNNFVQEIQTINNKLDFMSSKISVYKLRRSQKNKEMHKYSSNIKNILRTAKNRYSTENKQINSIQESDNLK